MVSWLNTPFLNGAAGATAGYKRFTVTGSQPVRALLDAYAYKLSSPGTVDLNGITRFQYYLPAPDDLPLWLGSASYRYVAADVTEAAGRRMAGTLFVAPASAFAPGVVPTPSQIRTNATVVLRGKNGFGPPNPDYRTTAGDLFMLFTEDVGHAFPPNTKYWLMICPTTHAAGSTPSIANDTPLGNIDVNGRAVSLWTNRTPLAPVINTPVAQSTMFPGSVVDLTFTPKDPDRVATFPGDLGPNDFDDVSGVQIQYAPKPTTAEPDPTWIDLPIANTAGSSFGRGWYIDQQIDAPANDGAKQFWQTHKLQIRCGTTNTLAPGAAYLPSGDWQIRLRTFDYGHPLPDSAGDSPYNDAPPLGDTSRTYTAATYPAVNTSPWSTPVNISVSDQVPKPIPLTPVNNIAIVENSPVPLTWQYRNTYAPPYVQNRRIVQLRHVGETGWFTLVDDNSASTTFTISPGDVDAGFAYQWRVQVRDSSGRFSDYSDPATFWVVPIPETGSVIPTPAETIDGATLGCGTHRIMIYRRGGLKRVGEIRGISHVEWNRTRDDMSTSKVIVNNWDVDCGNLLATLEPWAHEVVIFRTTSAGTERVWEGPITLLTYENERVVIHAKDVMAYAYRRIIKQKMSDVKDGAKVTDRAARVLQNVLAPDDPNVLAYLHVLANEDDPMCYRSTPEYGRTGFEEVDDMAANAGLDYTAVGRAILLWATKHRIGTLPEFRDKDLGNSPIVSVYGMSMANVYAVSDGNGIWGEATRLNSDGEDPTYGLVEMLSSTWASDSASDTGTYTEAGLETMRESFREAAERSIASRYPVPVVVRVPDNTRLNPDTVISIQHLVPGVVIPLRSTGTLREVVASQKLDAVKVVEENGEETITVTMSPFSRDDNAIEGGEE